MGRLLRGAAECAIILLLVYRVVAVSSPAFFHPQVCWRHATLTRTARVRKMARVERSANAYLPYTVRARPL